jgi:hypothetical protein
LKLCDSFSATYLLIPLHEGGDALHGTWHEPGEAVRMAMEIERPIEDREDRVEGVIMGWELWETAVGSDGQEPFGFIIFFLIIFLFCLCFI